MAYQQPYASSSAPPQPSPAAAVVGPQYCCTHPVDLAIVRKVMTIADKFTVTDINGNVVFKLQGSIMSLHDHRVLLDAAQKPVVTMRRKVCYFVHVEIFDMNITSYIYWFFSI